MADSVINVKLDMNGVEKKIKKICKNEKLGQVLATRGAEYMNEKYVPYRQGALTGSYIPKPFKITWTQPYARRHYNGFGDAYRQATHQTRQSAWDKPKDVKEFLAKIANDWLNHR